MRKINPEFFVTLGRLPLLRRLAGDGQWRFVFVESNCQGTKRRELRERRRIEQFNRFLGANHVARRVANLCFLYKNLSIDPSTLGQFPYSFEGMFVGLGDREMLSGFGLILKSNDEEIVIQTAVENFDTVHLSKIRVAESHRKSAHRAL